MRRLIPGNLPVMYNGAISDIHSEGCSEGADWKAMSRMYLLKSPTLKSWHRSLTGFGDWPPKPQITARTADLSGLVWSTTLKAKQQISPRGMTSTVRLLA